MNSLSTSGGGRRSGKRVFGKVPYGDVGFEAAVRALLARGHDSVDLLLECGYEKVDLRKLSRVNNSAQQLEDPDEG